MWQVLAEVGSGLAALHVAGVLHLDVKPANVYADAAGHLKLGDFGLAVLRHEWVRSDALSRAFLLQSIHLHSDTQHHTHNSA